MSTKLTDKVWSLVIGLVDGLADVYRFKNTFGRVSFPWHWTGVNVTMSFMTFECITWYFSFLLLSILTDFQLFAFCTSLGAIHTKRKRKRKQKCSKNKRQTSKKLFAFASTFARCEWTLRDTCIHTKIARFKCSLPVSFKLEHV